MSAILGAASPAPHWLWTLPFVAILLAIAVLPLIRATHHWWENNRNKLLVSVVLAAVTLGYYYNRATGYHESAPGAPSVGSVLEHSLLGEYVPFLTLLFSLYVIAGGIAVTGDLRATPLVNSAILGVGALIASFVGTTGASMVLIRPLLMTNRERKRVAHTVVFFIFLVSNVGGSLLPIGDPPLFLGYLRGVPFLWTLRLWKEWALCCAALLVIYYFLDRWMFRHETPSDRIHDRLDITPLRITGLVNILWLTLAVLAVALLDTSKVIPGTTWKPFPFLREGVLLALAGVSLLTTPRAAREANQFNYAAIGEVAALFLGIFITMQVPIEILHSLGPTLAERGFTHPYQYFWATGILSSFLDNAPTYVVFFEAANQLTHEPGPGIIKLITGEFIREDLLVAISCGAVFMGANTYIGNGPNFMVKAIAEQSGVKMPSFFGYMGYSAAILLPLFFVVTLVFFAY
ncbi:MAG: sodium:proton antiporter [Phycisphaerales bacterium]|nr:sodium:proton antiporter [Phycisphaerales bacterium]